MIPEKQKRKRVNDFKRIISITGLAMGHSPVTGERFKAVERRNRQIIFIKLIENIEYLMSGPPNSDVIWRPAIKV